MSNLPISFSLAEIPATFWYDFNTLGSVITATFTPPSDGRTYVVRGIDVFAGPGLGFQDASYEINGTGEMYFFHTSETDPLSIHLQPGAWRGAIPLGGGGNIAVRMHSFTPTVLGIVIWGGIIPINFPGFF
jgi:hypothetical protein